MIQFYKPISVQNLVLGIELTTLQMWDKSAYHHASIILAIG